MAPATKTMVQMMSRRRSSPRCSKSVIESGEVRALSRLVIVRAILILAGTPLSRNRQ